MRRQDLKRERGPKVQTYFFNKKKPKSGKPSEMPAGKKVVVNKRTGLPFLKGK